MKVQGSWTLAPALFCVFMSSAMHSQDYLGGALTMGTRDLAEIKRRAEAGDAAAQATLGNVLASKFQAADGLEWFRKAATNGNIQAQFHLGQMLLFGAPGNPKEQRVEPNPIEGLHWTFMAATNRHAQACQNMARVLRQGVGTSVDLVEAYAWLKVSSQTLTGSLTSKSEMNQIALKLSTADLKRADELAAQFKSGRWRFPVTRTIPRSDLNLKLSAIVVGQRPMAVINGKTFGEGESASVPLKNGTLTLKCVSIERDKVTVTVEGETAPRVLRLP